MTIPLATSVSTSEGTWATVAMGQLDQPLNTFWQLFHLPPGSSQWSNQVEATAVATNGGMALDPSGGNLTVGVVPSNDLTFTPLIATADGGQNWTNGLIDARLTGVPASLASDPASHSLALVGAGPGGGVLTASSGLSDWATLVTEQTLAATPDGRRCGLSGLTAVAFAGPAPLVGGSCTRAGVIPLFTTGPSGWHAVPLAFAAGGPVTVLGLRSDGATISGLLASGAGPVELRAIWSSGGGAGDWTVSPPLTLSRSQQIASFGPAGAAGEFVLLSDPDRKGSETLDVVDRSGGSWTPLPAPPAGTATVFIPPDGAPQALIVNDADLTVSALAGPAGPWTERQAIHVDLQPGSSG